MPPLFKFQPQQRGSWSYTEIMFCAKNRCTPFVVKETFLFLLMCFVFYFSYELLHFKSTCCFEIIHFADGIGLLAAKAVVVAKMFYIQPF